VAEDQVRAQPLARGTSASGLVRSLLRPSVIVVAEGAAAQQDVAAFDVLRFLLASVVLLGHTGFIAWPPAGNLAVQVFFALSGWLIGGILCRTAPRDIGHFYFNRSTRIWIPYFFSVIVLYLTSYLHEPSRSGRWSEFLVYDLTFTHNWFSLLPDADTALRQMPMQGTGNHFWSLAAEEQFYLFAPILMTLLPWGKKILPWACIALLAYLTRSQYASISLGVLAAVISFRYGKWHLGGARIAILGALLLASLLLSASFTYTWGAPVFAISVVLLCAVPARRSEFVRWLGGISYPMYLSAWMGIFAAHGLEKRLGLPEAGALDAIAGLAAAVLLYQFIDSRVLAKRKRFYRPAIGWVAGGVGYLLIGCGVLRWILAR
jgi:peptidoglycan/LPS O-acetylase OafA/YrhL